MVEEKKCSVCDKTISKKVFDYSMSKFSRPLCYDCQQKIRGDEGTGAWTYDNPKKEEEGKKATPEDAVIDVKSSEDEVLEGYDSELATELKAKSKELDKKIIEIVTAMSMPDKDSFYAWLKTVYGVDDLETLNIEQKEAVLNETEIMAKGKESEKVVEPENGEITVEIDEGTFSFQERDGGELSCSDADGNVYVLNITAPDCSCSQFQKDKSKRCPHLKAAAVGGFLLESEKEKGKPVKSETAGSNKDVQKKIPINWSKIPVQMLIPKLRKALEYTCEKTVADGIYHVTKSEEAVYTVSVNSCQCEDWERVGSSVNPCKHMIRVKYSDEEIRAKLKELGAAELRTMRKKSEKIEMREKVVDIAVQEPIIDSDMMITGMKPQLAELGKIKIGVKGEKMVRGHLLPKKLDHFMIATLMKDDDGRLEMDDSMNKIIGDKCTSLDICLCYDDFTMNMTSSYSWFAQSKLVCMGNGQTAMRRKEDGSEEKIICSPKECTAYKEKKCLPYGRLSVILASANRIGGVYVLRTHGWNTIRNVLSSMAFIRKEAGGVLAGLPLRMRLLPMTVTPRDVGHNVKIYSVNIEYPGTLAELKEAGAEEMERRLKLGINMKQTEDTYREAVKARMKEEAEEDARDIVEEFASEEEG